MANIAILVLALAGYCSATTFISNEMPLVKGNTITTLPKLGREYYVGLEVLTKAYTASWTSVLHVTTGGDHGIYGYRAPALFFKNRLFYFCSPINGNANKCVISKPQALNTWTKVEAFQRKIKGQYVYEVYINSVRVSKEINKKTQVFEDLKVYTADPWYAGHKGSIRNLKIQNLGFNSTFSLEGEDTPMRSNLVGIINKISKGYEVSFDFYPTSFTSSWTSVLHVSSGNQNVARGGRIPAVFFSNGGKNPKILQLLKDGKQTAHICSHINGNANYCYQTPYVIELNKWNTFVIRQKLCFPGVYVYSIEINGHALMSVQNKQALEYTNAYVYVGDKWYAPQAGLMRNLEITQMW